MQTHITYQPQYNSHENILETLKNMSKEELMEFMAKQAEFTAQQNILIQASVQQSRNILNDIKLIRDEVKENKIESYKTKEEVSQIKEEVLQIKKDIVDNIYLTDGQVSDLFVAVHNKTIELCKEKVDYGDDWYNLFRKYVSRIWWKIKKEFDVNRYTKIKRKDFNKAMNFVQNLKLEHVDYEG